MQKKASLNLSIQAIVILVIAIALLGLGLGFTKGIFGQLKSQLVIPPPDIPATADDPISLPSSQINIKAAKDTVLTVNFFNNGETDPFLPMLSCGPQNYLLFYNQLSPQQVDTQAQKSFKIVIKADTFSGTPETSPFPLGNNICRISFCRGSMNRIEQIYRMCAYAFASSGAVQPNKQIIIIAR
jgi:hypothetical protein